MFTKKFWADAAERAGKTFAQVLAAPLLVGGVGSLTHQPWISLLESALAATVLSLATSVVSLPVNGNGGASLLRSVHVGRHEASTTPTPTTTPEV